MDEDDNEWNSDNEAAVKHLGECGQGYLWMYQRDKRWYNKLYEYTKWSIVTVSLCSTFFSTLGLGLGISDHTLFVIIGTILSAVSTTAYGAISNMDISTKIDDLKHQGGRMSALVHNIRRQLSLSRSEREKASSYMFWITRSYDELIELGPEISERAQKEYELIANKSSMPYPEDVTSSSLIRINGENTTVVKRTITNNIIEEKKEEEKKEEEKEEEKKETIIKVTNKNEQKLTLKRLNSNIGGILSDAMLYCDTHMKYELDRLNKSN